MRSRLLQYDNEMSYGNKPNVSGKTVTVMTGDCRSYDSRLS
ncbi:MAG: hypothetical protein SPE04_00875 [Prevotella sp.]|nr:hypothetical protein [Prevotella sp.]